MRDYRPVEREGVRNEDVLTKKFLQQRYSIPEFVEKLHDSCNCMLMYWHYYKHRTWPDPSLPNKRHEGPLSMLTPEQYDLVMETLEDQQIERQLSVWKLRKEQNNVGM